MYRAISGLDGWMFYINVESLDLGCGYSEFRGRVVRPKTAVPSFSTILITQSVNIQGGKE
jgi:hypothetical protein